jgi:hypothetical protein
VYRAIEAPLIVGKPILNLGMHCGEHEKLDTGINIM